MDIDQVRELRRALSDGAACDARLVLARALGEAFDDAGHLLFFAGALLGPDRAAGKSAYGSDNMVGLATAAQIAGELCSAATSLAENDRLYAASALVRQLVEVEYLLWAFGEDQEEAERWMRSSKANRMKMWQPRHLRDRSGGRFRGNNYGSHCELGGHPTPRAVQLLRCHSGRIPAESVVLEIVLHGDSCWKYFLQALRIRDEDGVTLSQVKAFPAVRDLDAAQAHWQRVETLSIDHLRLDESDE